MLRMLLIILIFLHGAVHLMGFVKSVSPFSVTQLKQNISPLNGLLWLITAIIFLSAAIILLLKKDYWWLLGASALLISQFLIFQYWSDARYGTIANILILAAVILGMAKWNFAKAFHADVDRLLQNKQVNQVLTEKDLESLPEPIKKYIRHTGYLGKSKTSSFKAAFNGKIRSAENAEWMAFTADQYSNVKIPARYFFIKASMKGIPVAGYHRFQNGIAIMDIRALSLIKVQHADGPEMNISETVTHFNDMCLLAPGSLIDKRITWKTVNDKEVSATFTSDGITINAVLQFNEKGELINFISDDRYMIQSKNKAKKVRWMTPVRNYKESAGIRFPGEGEAIWVLPQGSFTYATMNINSVNTNPER